MTLRPRPACIALVDISYLFKRNWHAMPADPRGATRQTLADVDALRAAVNHLIVCRDAPPYRRADRFPDYKAKRPAPEPEERAHKRWLFEQMKERGLPMAWSDGYEADDVIATLAKAYGQWCADVRLVTNDKDAAQCVGGSVVQYVPATGEKGWEVRDRDAVEKKFGVTPEQMPLWQALQGDDSDNIPGIKGIGKATATDLVKWFGTLPGIITALGSKDARIKPSIATKLGAGLTDLNLYIELVTLATDVPLDPEALLGTPDPAPAGREASVDVELTGYMGNATPPTSPEGEAAYRTARELYEDKLAVEPPPRLMPRIGKDPQADAILAKAALERKTAAMNTNAPKTEVRIDETQARVAQGNQAERDRQAAIHREYERQREAESEFDPISRAPGAKAAEPAVVYAKVAPMPKAAPKPGLAKAELKGLALLRAPFSEHQISKLPKGTKSQNTCPPSEKRSCNICGGWHHPQVRHLDYVGHAALTDRLLEADPQWSWEPMAFTPSGLPLFDSTGGLWIRLTVCGVTRLGYGHAGGKPFEDAGSREKEIIGDALRNAAMRFGAALELWHKGDRLHGEDWNNNWESVA